MILGAIQFPNIDPALFTIPDFPLFGQVWGPFPLRWYALAYIAGLILGWRWMVWLIRRDRLWAPGRPAMSAPQADDFLFWATLGVIIGGRLGYVLFYNTNIIWTHPAQIFHIWEGGMSFHGGLIGVILAAFFFCYRFGKATPTSPMRVLPRLHVNEEQFAALAKKHVVAEPPADKKSEYVRLGGLGWLKKSEAKDARAKSHTDKVALLRLGDLAAAATPIGLFFGRIANFINGELWGRHTDASWGVVFCNTRLMQQHDGFCPAGLDPRHPSQLYEATLEGLVLFTIINIATLKFDSLRRPGLNIGLFLICYGLFRALLETVREPDSQMPDFLRGHITMGMLLCIPMIIAGAWLIRRAFRQPKLATA